MGKYKDMKQDFWNGNIIRFLEHLFDVFILGLTFLLIAELNYLENKHSFLGIYDLFVLHSDDILVTALYLIIAAFFFMVYQVTISRSKFYKVFISMFMALFFTNIILIIITFINIDNFILGTPLDVLYILIAQVIVLPSVKYLEFILFNKFSRKPLVAVIGPKEDAINLAKEFFMDKTHYKVLKYVLFEDDRVKINDDVFKYIDEVDHVYLLDDLSVKNKNMLVNYILLNTNKELYMVPRTYELGLLYAQKDQIDDTLVLKAKSMRLTFEQRFFKRSFDIFVSIIGLIIAVIPMLIIALLIKIQDGGPVLYRQTRIKRNNEEFQIVKFRSMHVNCDAMTGPVHAGAKDSRITKLGRFMRATRLDELPQIFNVLKGEMSIVGPRPLIPSEIEETIESHPEFMYRSNVKPGLTGMSQVYSRYDTMGIERLRYDLFYIRRYNFWLDVKLILLTVRVMFDREAGLGRESNTTFEMHVTNNYFELNQITSGFELKGEYDGKSNRQIEKS